MKIRQVLGVFRVTQEITPADFNLISPYLRVAPALVYRHGVKLEELPLSHARRPVFDLGQKELLPVFFRKGELDIGTGDSAYRIHLTNPPA
jgi:hypothetical protein